MMSITFNTRERILLVVLALLLVGGLYYLFVYQPTNDTITASQQTIAEIADVIVIEEVKAGLIEKMRTELAQVDAASTTAAMPEYDNFRFLLDELNNALARATDYQLSFKPPVIADGVASRQLQLVFYADNYSAASRIIKGLYGGPYRCDITSFKLVPTDAGNTDLEVTPVTATLSVTYYELSK